MKKYIAKMDLWLLLIMFIFAAFGLLMIFSSSSIAAVLRYQVDSSYFFLKQLFFIVVSFFVGIVIVLKIKTDYYYKFVPWLAIGIIIVLLSLFVYGEVANGAQSWYRKGIFGIQPLEFAKSIMIMFMAIFYNYIYYKTRPKKYAALFPVGYGLIISFLTIMQPDLGGALIVIAITGLIFIAVPLNKELKIKIFKVLGIGFLIVVVLFLITGKHLLNSMQSSRLNFLNPCSRYMEDTGYQVCNGYIAIHNGGLLGVGLGDSTQKYLYLPEAHTDFIFPIICEELGAIVGILVILLYAALLYRILKISKEASNLKNSILAYGTFLLILCHVLVNLLGVLGLIPLTGVPLPFLSYGGSFNVNVILMLFVVERVAIENSEAAISRKMKELRT